MFSRTLYRDYLVFIGLYLALSLPPFLALNLEFVRDVYTRVVVPDLTIAAALVLLTFFILYLLTLADDGVDRYVDFMAAPTDALSVLVVLSFIWAAVSWWAVPELVFVYDLDLTLTELLLPILASQVPMLFFLSLLTAIGRARKAGT